MQLSEGEIFELVYDKKMRNWLKQKFKLIYDDYEANIPEWVLDCIKKYNANFNKTIRNYVIQTLNFKFLNVAKHDKYQQLKSNASLEYLDTVGKLVENEEKNVDLQCLTDLIQDYSNVRKKRKCIDIFDLVSNYYDVAGNTQTKRNIAKKNNISQRCLNIIISDFINYIKSSEERKDILREVL